MGAIEEELQKLRDLVAQLKADNERLHQKGASAISSSSSVPSTSVPSSTPSTASIPVTQRLFCAHDRKCPMFRGRSSIGLNEWVKEKQACMKMQHLSTSH